MNSLRRLLGRLLAAGLLFIAVLPVSGADPVYWPSPPAGANAFPQPAPPAFPQALTPTVPQTVPQAHFEQQPSSTAFPSSIAETPPILDPATPRWYRRAWQWRILPEGLLYKSYLAGIKESRFAAQWMYEQNAGWIWDIALGGRVGVLRWGTEGPIDPEGWQLDMEGAALPRLDLGAKMDLVACDYRFGLPLTYARGRQQTKFGYYHLSSHLGDEWMIRHPSLTRINYGRDALVLGHSIHLTERIRVYAETAWAFQTGEYTKPWEFQFGAEYSQRRPMGRCFTPFMAVNGHLREEVDFGGNVTVQAGWQWRGQTGALLRLGAQYLAGMSDQFEFYNQYESKVGFGIWYDY